MHAFSELVTEDAVGTTAVRAGADVDGNASHLIRSAVRNELGWGALVDLPAQIVSIFRVDALQRCGLCRIDRILRTMPFIA